ncbi:hypothetical protein KXS07_32385 [Inquilinus limosus]|uniref:hypothetical protein n=1 Tax=Inquilinus limosus TaxID=171674 RepID=UPI003F1402E7
MRYIRVFVGLLLTLPLCCPVGRADDKLVPSGTVTIDQTQVAFLVSGSMGGGQLTFRGKTYHFSVGGLGIGGIGVSTLEAEGQVYNLTSVADFPGLYGSARLGYAFGDKGEGRLWLQNDNGVILELRARRQGLALTAGVDGVDIRLTR